MNSWFRAIDSASTEDEIVAQAQDFCALIHPRDLAALPEDARRIRIESREDIPRLHERLEACGAAARSRAFDAQKVGDLLAYLSKANARLGEIGNRL